MIEMKINRESNFFRETTTNKQKMLKKKGNKSRFINHSCDPNCKTQKLVAANKTCISLFAIKNIEFDEELTFNYSFQINSDHKTTKCLCNALNCVGSIGCCK